MRPGAKAALAIWLSAIVWDVLCPPGETFSEAIERGLNDRRTEFPVMLLIFLTTAHLLRSLPERFDVYSVTFTYFGKLRKEKQ